MTTYTIHHTNGSRNTEDSQQTCIDVCADLYGDETEIGEEEQDGLRAEDGGQPMRRLVWATEEESEGDDGARAVASIKWIDSDRA